MELILNLLTTLGFGAISLWLAIFTGLGLKLHPVAAGLMSVLGAIIGALFVILLGNRVRTWLVKRRGGKDKKKQHGSIYRIYKRCGVIGLGLLAPLITGAPLGVAIGLALGEPARRLLLWISLGTILWGTILTIIGALGIISFKGLAH